MAITNVYGESEFQMAIKAETTIGTALLTTMQLMNVDTITQPDPGVVDIRDIKSGVGRTMKAADVIIEDKAVSKTFTIAGIADATVLKILVSNVMTVAMSTTPASFDIPFNYTQPELTHGTTSITDDTRTLTLVWVSAETGKAIIYNGCVVTDLTISADANTDGGLVRYNATIMTGYIPLYDQSDPTSMTARATTYFHLFDWDTTRQIAGTDVILASFELVFANPTVALGNQGSNGDPEMYSRGVPGISASGTFNVKFDDSTGGGTSNLLVDHKDGEITAFEFSNHATFSSATTFGFLAPFGKLRLPEVNALESGVFMNVGVDFTGSTSGDLIQLIV